MAEVSLVPDVVDAGLVLRNSFNGETFIFNDGATSDDVARFDVVLESGGSGGGNALVHVHPCAGGALHRKVRSPAGRRTRPSAGVQSWRNGHRSARRAALFC